MVRSEDPKARLEDAKAQRGGARRGRLSAAVHLEPRAASRSQADQSYRRFLELATEGIWRYDLDPPVATDLPVEEQAEAILERARLTECNAAFARLFGCESPEEMLGRPLREILAGSHEEQAQLIAHSIRSGYRITDLEVTSRDRHGGVVRALNSVVGLVENGRLVCGWGTTRDITNLNEAERAAQEAHAEVKATLDAVPDLLFELDGQGRICRFHAPDPTLLYAPPQAFLGKRVDEVLPRDASGIVLQALAEAEKVGSHRGAVYSLDLPQGRRWFELSIARKGEGRGAEGRVILLARDITGRVEAEEALRASEGRLSLALEATSDGIYDVDFRTGMTYYSPGYATMLGYRPEELIPSQATWEGLLHPDDKEKVVERLNRCLAGECDGYEMEFRLRAKTGEWRWILSHGRVVGRDAKGKALRLVGTHRDISDRKVTERAVRESEEKYRLLVENAGEAIFVAQDGLLRFANPATARMLGRTPEEVASLPFTDFIHPDDRAQVVDRHRRRLAGDKVETGYSFRVVRADGETRWMEIDAVRIAWQGRPATLNFVSDVTERHRAQAVLQESEERFRQIFKEGPMGMVTLDPDFQYMRANATFCRMVGYAEQELLGRTFADITHPDHVPGDIEGAKKVLHGETPVYRTEKRYVRKDGQVVWGGVTASAIRDPGGEFLYYLVMIEDITDRKQAAARMEAALNGTVRALATTSEVRDPYTAGHQDRVTLLALTIGHELGLTADELDGLRVAGLLHDVGKISVPAEILSKPSALSAAELALVKSHSETGYAILKGVNFPWPIAEIVLEHHERLDGSGYPRGLRADAILPEARILAVADTVEAMASHRPYRAALGIKYALDVIEKGKGILYDANVVDACQKAFSEGGFAFGEETSRA
jgi:PAS domain S-box-containing protein/putative nucleotidyltransferase with HDIG domain